MTSPTAELDSLSPAEKRELLATLLRKKARAGGPSAGPLSYGQQALWHFHQLDPISAAYNLAVD